MIRILKNILNMFNQRKEKWDITDTIIKIESIVKDQILPDFDNIQGCNEKMICIRNFKHACIYIKEQDYDKFLEQSYFCDKERKLVNITRLVEYSILEDCISKVANKAVPPQVDIKEIKVCKYKDLTIYVVRIIILKPSDHLFKSLINLQFLKDKYNL